MDTQPAMVSSSVVEGFVMPWDDAAKDYMDRQTKLWELMTSSIPRERLSITYSVDHYRVDGREWTSLRVVGCIS